MTLAVEGLDFHYGDAQALAGVGFTVPEGEIVAIIGANGAGKTSLIRAIAGMLKPSAGHIHYRGQNITGWPSHKVCEAGIGQVAEGRQIFPSLTVMENLETGAMIPRGRARFGANLARVLDLFPRLAERKRQAAGTLSGGEQQMLAIGRCLMGSPELIMFDEPSLGLSPAMAQEVFRIIRALHEQGLTVVLVEQNVALSLKLSDHAIVLENGRIAARGTGAELLADDRIRKAYLGL
jgi:branched-chain amino acid transport system ATP-binding protein